MYHKSGYLPRSTSVFKVVLSAAFESTFSPGEGFAPAALSKINDHLSAYPRATSSIIMRLKPTAKKMVPMLECSPSDISGISSSTTT